MHSVLLLILLVLGALGAVVFAWPAPGGILLMVITAVGGVGLVPRFLEGHRMEAIVLAKGACLLAVGTGWGLGIQQGLHGAQGADAALIVTLIGLGSLGLLSLGLLEVEAQASASLGRAMSRRQSRRRRSRHELEDPVEEASRWLEQLDGTESATLDEDTSTGRLTAEELYQVELWSERLRGAARPASTDLFTEQEMEEMRQLARRLGLRDGRRPETNR